jgi:hypothetical protein
MSKVKEIQSYIKKPLIGTKPNLDCTDCFYLVKELRNSGLDGYALFSIIIFMVEELWDKIRNESARANRMEMFIAMNAKEIGVDKARKFFDEEKK